MEHQFPGTLDQCREGAEVENRCRGPGVNSLEMQRLASIDIADASHDSLVEQHLADRALVKSRPTRNTTGIEPIAENVGTQVRYPQRRINRLAGQLDHRSVETHSEPVAGLNDNTSLSLGSLPSVAL